MLHASFSSVAEPLAPVNSEGAAKSQMSTYSLEQMPIPLECAVGMKQQQDVKTLSKEADNPHSPISSCASEVSKHSASIHTRSTPLSKLLVKEEEDEDEDEEEDKADLVVCFGEMLIDFVPTLGGYSLAEAPSYKKAPGGAPANVAVGIARLGGHSAFVGKVGDDEFGHMLKGILSHYGVDSSAMRFDANARTALAFVTLRDDGEREFMFYRNPSADMLLQENELDTDLIARASIFHYGSISLISEPCRSAHLAAMRTAKKFGALLSYDPNVRLPLWPSAEEARSGIMSIWEEADLIKVSDEEIAFLTDGKDPLDDNVVMELWHPGLKLLLVTEGQDGCRYYTKSFHGRVGGFKVSAIDTTGAGDAFVGGVLSQLVSDKLLYEDEGGLREALRFANACGALTTTERGAIPALPDKDTVLRLITNVDRSRLVRAPSWQNISQWRVPSRQQSRDLLCELLDHEKAINSKKE